MTDIQEIKSDVKSILEILNGNGKIGVCAKVNVLWSVSLFFIISILGLLLRVFILK